MQHLLFPLLLLVVAFAHRIEVQSFSGQIKPDSYIVTLKPGVDVPGFLASQPTITATHVWTSNLLNGFAGVLSAAQTELLRAHDAVESIAEDGFVRLASGAPTATRQVPRTNEGTLRKRQSIARQTLAPWGLGRLSSSHSLAGNNPTSLQYTFLYYSPFDGRGTDIYVVDTGLFDPHVQFSGRAVTGYAGDGLPLEDDNGHGTYMAGIAAGTQLGVAKGARIFGAKAFDANGFGTVSDIIDCLQWVLQEALSSGRPSVALVSYSGGPSSLIDNAIASMILQGLPVVVPAGDNNSNASFFTPGRVPGAITVASSNILDARSTGSNIGQVIDIFAPGDTIMSAWIPAAGAAPTYRETNTLSGTPAAAAFVAGLISHYLSAWISSNPDATSDLFPTPAQIISDLWSVNDVLSGVPPGTPNRLARTPVVE